MAKSKARKQREKSIREGKLDPAIKRGATIPLPKQTKTRKETLQNWEHKHKGRTYSTDEYGRPFRLLPNSCQFQ